MYTLDRDEEVLLPKPEINYTLLGSILLESAYLYLDGKSVAGTWDGLVHGKKGKLRAERLIEYLKYCGIEKEQSLDESPSKPEINEKGLLALLLAIFGEESSWIPLGRSSRLAALIADRMIIIRKDAIDFSAPAVPLEYSISYCFDPIRGVRSLLSQVLWYLPLEERNALKDLAKILRKKLIDKFLEIKPNDLICRPDWVSKFGDENEGEPVYAKPIYAEPVYADPVYAEDIAGSSRGSDSLTLTLFYGYQKTLLSDDKKQLKTQDHLLATRLHKLSL